MPTLGQQFVAMNALKDPNPRWAARRLRNLFRDAPDHVVSDALTWYDQAHETAARGARQMGLSTHQGAGIMAAISPGSEYSGTNVPAFHELGVLRDTHGLMDIVRDSAVGIGTKSPEGGHRSLEADEVLQKYAPHLRATSDAAIMKADRIASGERWEDVLPRDSAPKTHSFATNIEHPDRDSYVTVDGRHSDILVDRMRPWREGQPVDINGQKVDSKYDPNYFGKTPYRGIGGREAKSGLPPKRYRDMEEVTQRVAHSLGILPHQLQAAVWVHAKGLETGYNHDRDQGDTRILQSYQSRNQAFSEGRL